MAEKVLVVDDIETNRYLLESLLRTSGLEVITAQNGQDALDKAHLDPPDLIITDILMPVMDGYTLCRRWKSDEQFKHIPFVFYTATYTDPKDEALAMSLGADRFILKPQEPDILLDTITELLEKNWTSRPSAGKPLGEEMDFFRQYNETLFRKLEKKVLELEETNQKLRLLEEQFRLSYEHITDVIFSIGADLRVLSVSPSIERILGYKPEEIIDHPISDLRHMMTPESLELAAANISQVLNGEIIAPSAYQFIARNGTIKLGEINRSLMIRDGRVVGMIAVARDITERKRTEDALRKSEEHLRLVTDNMVDLVLQMDDQGLFRYFAPNVTRLFGFEVKELLGKSAFDFVYPDDRAAAMSAFLEAIQTGHGSVEARILHKEGHYTWMDLIGKTFYTDKGEAQGIIMVGRDIAAKKQVQEELISLSQRLNDIIDFLPDATLVIDREGRVITWNRAIEAMTGVKAEEMLGKDDYEYAIPFYGEKRPILIDLALHPDPERERAYKSVQRTGDTIIGEILGTALSPGNVHLSATASVLRDSKGEIVGAIECIRDTTDRKEMEERLQRAEKMESLGVLAGGVAHDLNNVLGVLVGYSELLLHEVPEESHAGKYAKSIHQGGERAAAIIQDLLTMARRGVSVSETVNLNRIVTDFLKTPEFELLKFRHPDILFKSQLEPALFNIKGSPIHLFKTIMNLLSNAAESIKGVGAITISTDNRYVDTPIPGYENTQEGEYVVLTVSDTGSGITPTDLGRIFEPFYTKKVMGRSGTGLGLALVWGTVKDHGGYIDVRSEENEGSTFTLYFPVTRDVLAKGDQQKISADSLNGRGELILIVDDVEAQRLLASTILENMNYKTAMVANGYDAVEYLKNNKADLVVLDMIMEPGIDGLETYRRILTVNSQQKAIIVSGFSRTERVRMAQELGAGEYLTKPYIIEKLGLAVRKELDRK